MLFFFFFCAKTRKLILKIQNLLTNYSLWTRSQIASIITQLKLSTVAVKIFSIYYWLHLIDEAMACQELTKDILGILFWKGRNQSGKGCKNNWSLAACDNSFVYSSYSMSGLYGVGWPDGSHNLPKKKHLRDHSHRIHF